MHKGWGSEHYCDLITSRVCAHHVRKDAKCKAESIPCSTGYEWFAGTFWLSKQQDG